MKHAPKFLILKILGKMNVNYMTMYGASMNQSSINSPVSVRMNQ